MIEVGGPIQGMSRARVQKRKGTKLFFCLELLHLLGFLILSLNAQKWTGPQMLFSIWPVSGEGLTHSWIPHHYPLPQHPGQDKGESRLMPKTATGPSKLCVPVPTPPRRKIPQTFCPHVPDPGSSAAQTLGCSGLSGTL